MQNPRSISELLKRGKAVSQLRIKSQDRARILEHVKSALPDKLASAVLTAGLEGERLTLGVTAGVWASRLRFHAEDIRQQLSERVGAPVNTVRIRIIAPVTGA